ncbi:hypothetical protein OC844_008071 [Tilletia horrida]|nr:hypothetical protein OC844_008071 [Tilletia horrida]
MLRSVASEDSLYDDNAHHDADGRSSFYSQRTGHSTTTTTTSSSGAAEVASSIRTWSRATSSPRSGWSARERASGSSTPTRPSTAQDLALLTPPGGVVRALSSSSSAGAAAGAGVSAFGRGGAGSTAAQPSPATPFKTLFQSHHQHTHTHTSAVRVSSPGGTRSTATADDDDGDDDIVEDDEDGQEDGMIATQAPPGSATLSPPARGHAHAHAGPLRLGSADLAFTGDYSFSSISSSSSTNHHHPANHTEFSPLPKWENRKEVSDWIERKTRERGLLHGAQGTPGVGVGVGAGVGSGGEQQLCAEWWTRDVDELAAGGQGGSGSGSGHQAQAMPW